MEFEPIENALACSVEISDAKDESLMWFTCVYAENYR